MLGLATEPVTYGKARKEKFSDLGPRFRVVLWTVVLAALAFGLIFWAGYECGRDAVLHQIVGS